jgi:LysM repeat protein
MSERSLPIVDGAPACPFVAFEDDRDGRSLAPDHRHRCFAEARPAPRALAHQEAYCLSSAFPVCPAFQDWARREAAATRPAVSGAPPAREEPPVSQPTPVASQAMLPLAKPMPPRDLEPLYPSGGDDPAEVQPRRNPHRDWAAPPPWVGDEGAAPVEADPPPFLVKSEPDPYQGTWSGDGRGLAGSQADRLAGPDPDVPAVGGRAQPDDDAALDDAWPGAGVAAVAAASTPTGSPRYAAQRRDARRDRRAAPGRPRPTGTQQPAGGSPAGRDGNSRLDPADLFGPAWEKPRRYEAYPTLRTRIGLPGLKGISRLGMAAIGLVAAAVILFFVGPMLLGIGGQDRGAGNASQQPAASVLASDSPEPTLAPAPTPKVYVVVKNDTFSKIAKKFKVSVAALKAANPQIKNVNKISPGDEITIPVPVAEDAASASPADSTAP